MSWQHRAACRNQPASLFFVERDSKWASSVHVEVRATINEFCVPCPVRAQCLEIGMREWYGIWGGTTPKERKALRALIKGNTSHIAMRLIERFEQLENTSTHKEHG